MTQRPADRLADELLVLAAQGGEREAFAELAERWQERLWRHARRVTGRDDLAWEATQDAWLAMSTRLGVLRRPSQFGSWALSIVTRRALDSMRRGDRYEVLESEPAIEAAPDVADDSAAGALRLAFDALDPEGRALLALHHVEGLGLAELSDALGIPVGTVKSRLHALRQKLRETLDKQ